MVSAPIAAIGWLGVTMLWEIDRFHARLGSWVAVPEWSRTPVALLGPLAGMLIAGLWFGRLAPRAAVALALVVLIGCATVLGAQTRQTSVDACVGCLSPRLAAERLRHEARAGLPVVVGAAAAVAAGAWLIRRSPSTEHGERA